MAVETYRYEPDTGRTFLVSGDAEAEFLGDTTSLLNGGYRLAGNQLVDVSTGQLVQLGSGDVTISRMTSTTGRVVVDVTSGITARSLNGPGGRMASYSITGDVTVMDQTGSEHVLSIDAASVTGYGQRLLTYADAEGVQRYEAVSYGDYQEQVIRDLYAESARWATAGEYTQAAIMGYIGRNERQLVRDIQRAGGMVDDFGQLQDSGSGIVRALASIASGSLNYSKSIRIRDSGQIGSLYG